MSKETPHGPLHGNGSTVGVATEPHARLPIGETNRMAWFDELINGMLAGGVYLIAGSPGARKSGVATQLAVELGARDIMTTTILTEETERRFLDRASRLTSEWPKREAQRAISLARCDARISDLEQLPGFLMRDVLAPHGRYAGSKLIVVDSVQGHATPSSIKRYARLFEFDQLARSAGIAIVLINQLTKSNRLSGPRALEHHAEVVLQLAKVGDFRVLSLTKNRFGPEQPNGLALLIDPATTELRPSPHITPITGCARTYMGLSIGESEIQAAVSLPSPGSRPSITAPGLPRRRIELILSAISGLPMLDLGSFAMSISALLPGDTTFRGWLSLPLAVALISSCLRRSVPRDTLFLGEIDLNRAIRPLPQGIVDALSAMLLARERGPRLRLVVPPSAAEALAIGPGVSVLSCETLDQVVYAIWPDTH